MGKYRHKVTGKVGVYDDGYAAAVSALEPVSDDTPVAPCDPCGPTLVPETTAGVVSRGYDVEPATPANEPSDSTEGE